MEGSPRARARPAFVDSRGAANTKVCYGHFAPGPATRTRLLRG